MTLLYISREIKSSRSMALIDMRSSLRILWAAATTVVFLTRCSAAPAFGETNKAMVSTNLVITA